MKRFQLPLLIFLSFLLFALSVHAGDTTTYQTGKLIDLRREGSSFCLAIQVEEMSYIVVAPWTSTTLIVGDPIAVRVKLRKPTKFWNSDTPTIYIKTDNSHYDDHKVRIIRMERIGPDAKPSICALPVAVEH